EAVAQVAGPVASDLAPGGRLDVEPVAHVDDLVVLETESPGVPDVDPRALLPGLSARQAADPAAAHDGAVRLAQVDPEDRPLDAAVPDGGPRRRHVDARGVVAEVASAEAVDVEALHRHAF